jgi:peptidoglycan hydrolase-like protein with peptidoglycan-binding domain
VVEVKPVAVPEPVPAAPPSAEVPATPLTKDEIKELQGKLGAVGFGPGPIDGVVGAQTQAALRRYADSRGLANPEATRELLSRLKAESSARK